MMGLRALIITLGLIAAPAAHAADKQLCEGCARQERQSEASPATAIGGGLTDALKAVSRVQRAPAIFTRDNSIAAQTSAQIVELLNEYRAGRGLKAVVESPALARAAQKQCEYVARKDSAEPDYFNTHPGTVHLGPDGKDARDRLFDVGACNYRFGDERDLPGNTWSRRTMPLSERYPCGRVAENAVRRASGTTAEELSRVAMNGWKNSTGHNANLLLPEIEEVGTATCQPIAGEYAGYFYFVQIYAKRTPNPGEPYRTNQ